MTNPIRLTVLALAAALALVSCRAETQNRFRRQVLDVANVRQYITLFTIDGREVFRGQVDGKVTRAEEGAGGATAGDYVFWFDPTGKYYQTNLPYLLTTDANRTGQLTSPTATGTAGTTR